MIKTTQIELLMLNLWVLQANKTKQTKFQWEQLTQMGKSKPATISQIIIHLRDQTQFLLFLQDAFRENNKYINK